MILNLFLFGCLERRLLLEVASLRQQLTVYKRTVGNPKLKNHDRIFWVILSRLWKNWKSTLVIVKPETVIDWQRRRFKKYWRGISKPKSRPPVPKDHIDLIRRISADHPEYGAERIAGILQENFGIYHAVSTVEKYRIKIGKPPRGTQTWSTFLKNHGSAIWCCDFMVQFTFRFIPVYVFVVMELESRKIVWFGVTRHPTLRWVKQQIRNASFDVSPRFLIHDNDGIFGQHRVKVINEETGRVKSYRSSLDFWLSEVMGLKGIPIPYGAPNANAHCERLIGTLRRECLDHMLVFNERHLYRTVREFVDWYNRLRFH